MDRRVLVILGHPDAESFCGALAKAYCEGAKTAGYEVRELRLGELEFDPVLWHGYNRRQALEPDLLQAWESIQWSTHLVFVYPNWWGTMPALMKGFFDRLFLPGFAFKYRDDSPWWDKLLSGRTAQLMVTMDTPSPYYRWIYRRPGHNEMRRTILGFCGIKVTRISEFAPVRGATPQRRAEWLAKAKQLGAKH